MKILVTGSAGFIGSHLCESLLHLGHEVVGIDNFDRFYARNLKECNLNFSRSFNDFQFIELDFYSDLQKLKSLPEFEILVHVGARAGVRPSIDNPIDYINSNIIGTNNLLDLMNSRGIKKLVFASSSSIYGNSKDVPFREDLASDLPISPYAMTKRSCEMMNYTYHNLHGIDVINLRFFTVYGPCKLPLFQTV